MEAIQSLEYIEAKLATDVIMGELDARSLSAVIAVADACGELLSLSRIGGAPRASIAIAQNKAWTSAREGVATSAIGEAVKHPQTGFDINYFGDLRYLGWGGGVPVKSGNRTIGSVAVSGLSEKIDEELARLGAMAIEKRIAEQNAEAVVDKACG
jgi:glc operon protein GlcG